MIPKIAVCILSLIAVSQAGGLYDNNAIGYDTGLGYGSHGYGSSYYGVSPYSNYLAPIVKALAPVPYTTSVAYTPAISTVSQYSIHQAPIVKSYAPFAYTSYTSPYLSHSYNPAITYDNYGSYPYSNYGGKYAW